MQHVTMPLGEGIFENATLTTYVHEQAEGCPHGPRAAILVLPGGAYSYCSDREAEPIALAYMQAGLNAYVLRYSVEEKAKFPQPLLEACRAMKVIRDRAALDNTDPTRVFAIGFSAGGHLASALATCWHREEIKTAAGVEDEESKPTGVILSYPVISGGPVRHEGTFCNLCGKDEPSDEERAVYSTDRLVSEHTPPVFLWHTAEDAVVPVENSLLMASALAEKKIPFALHIFPRGPHGLALCNEQTSVGDPALVRPDAQAWLSLSLTWLNDL